jgi:hypothetical protein
MVITNEFGLTEHPGQGPAGAVEAIAVQFEDR